MVAHSYELVPANGEEYFQRTNEQMIDLYQNADGFLHPGTIGPPPGYWCDGKYTVSLIEAGLSGCIIFWHDAMSVGNSMKTVFEVSLNPVEIAERIKDVVGSIDLDKHSTETSEEFRLKYGIENTVSEMMRVIQSCL